MPRAPDKFATPLSNVAIKKVQESLSHLHLSMRKMRFVYKVKLNTIYKYKLKIYIIFMCQYIYIIEY